MKASHILAFVGDMLCGGVEIGEDVAKAVHEECPEDVANSYEDEGFGVDVFLSHKALDEEDCIYSGSAYGWLPEDESGIPYEYAYRA